MEEHQNEIESTQPSESPISSKSFLVISVGLIALILLSGGLLIGYLYGNSTNDSDELPMDPNYIDNSVNEDPVNENPIIEEEDGSNLNVPLEQADNSRTTFTTDIPCTNPFSFLEGEEMEEELYQLSIDTFPYEEAEENSYGCGYTIKGGLYSLNVEISYEGAGYLVTEEEQIPEYELVKTPKLDVDYLESSSVKSVKRLKNKIFDDTYNYTSYFEIGEENCKQWESVRPILGCGVSGITLVDTAINVTCSADEEDVVYCDQLMESLSIEKL